MKRKKTFQTKYGKVKVNTNEVLQVLAAPRGFNRHIKSVRGETVRPTNIGKLLKKQV